MTTPIKLGPLQEQWLAALESGNYTQGTDRLHIISRDTYCCLGVACRIHDIPYRTREDVIGGTLENVTIALFDGGHSGCLPERLVQKLGFHGDLGELYTPEDPDTHPRSHLFHAAMVELGYTGERNVTLATYNDKGATFAQIAAAIRKHPDAVFSKSV